MNPDLVGAAGERRDFEQGSPVPPLDNPVKGEGWLAPRASGTENRMPGLKENGEGDLPSLFLLPARELRRDIFSLLLLLAFPTSYRQGVSWR